MRVNPGDASNRWRLNFILAAQSLAARANQRKPTPYVERVIRSLATWRRRNANPSFAPKIQHASYKWADCRQRAPDWTTKANDARGAQEREAGEQR
ncbi:Hypothetical protein BN69_2075 [Methylocystis sp. SC2]|nr:Hypothetical protein BN69_2075 [Methylocystis sp. SC2]